MTKQKYKIELGLWKSVKNVLIVWGIPVLVLLIDNWTEWIPKSHHAIAIPLIGLIAYFVKNYTQNR